MGRPGPAEPLPGDRRPADLGENRGVITTTVLSGIIAIAVAAAEWTASGEALTSPTGILWSVVAVLGISWALGMGWAAWPVLQTPAPLTTASVPEPLEPIVPLSLTIAVAFCVIAVLRGRGPVVRRFLLLPLVVGVRRRRPDRGAAHQEAGDRGRDQSLHAAPVSQR